MKRYPEEVHQFMTQNVQGKTTRELVALINDKFGPIFTESKMKSYKKNHELKSGTQCGLPVGHATKTFPMEIKNFIAENHKGIGPKEMTELLNTVNQIKAYYKNHKTNSGLKGYFAKGHVPFNKGKKKYWLGGEETQFKKGNRPHNWVPIGSERISKDGYIEIKIQEGQFQKNWKGKHILTWETHNGPVPKGHVIIFGDGNNRNFDPGNLILVSRKQLAILNRNKLIQNDADLTRTAVITADLILKIGERKAQIRKRVSWS